MFLAMDDLYETCASRTPAAAATASPGPIASTPTEPAAEGGTSAPRVVGIALVLVALVAFGALALRRRKVARPG